MESSGEMYQIGIIYCVKVMTFKIKQRSRQEISNTSYKDYYFYCMYININTKQNFLFFNSKNDFCLFKRSLLFDQLSKVII